MMRVCQRQGRLLWESLRESLSVPPFSRAFLKSPSSRGLSAIAELLVTSLRQWHAAATLVWYLYFLLKSIMLGKAGYTILVTLFSTVWRVDCKPGISCKLSMSQFDLLRCIARQLRKVAENTGYCPITEVSSIILRGLITVLSTS